MRIKAWIRAYFGFSRLETNGFIILLPLTLLIIIAKPVSEKLESEDYAGYAADRHLLDSLTSTWKVVNATDSVAPVRWTYFDPNRLDSGGWVRLGVLPALGRTITRYRQKGGVFRKKDDLLRIHGMDTAWLRKASPWIRISSGRLQEKQDQQTRSDINAADSLQLMRVRGIGPVLSRRIRDYRDRLGGFVFLNQLYEVYGLDSSLVEEIMISFEVKKDFLPRQLSVNESTREELARHPYISWSRSKSIVLYRFQHGPFSQPADLRKVRGLDSVWVEKVSAYLKF